MFVVEMKGRKERGGERGSKRSAKRRGYVLTVLGYLEQHCPRRPHQNSNRSLQKERSLVAQPLDASACRSLRSGALNLRMSSDAFYFLSFFDRCRAQCRKPLRVLLLSVLDYLLSFLTLIIPALSPLNSNSESAVVTSLMALELAVLCFDGSSPSIRHPFRHVCSMCHVPRFGDISLCLRVQ